MPIFEKMWRLIRLIRSVEKKTSYQFLEFIKIIVRIFGWISWFPLEMGEIYIWIMLEMGELGIYITQSEVPIFSLLWQVLTMMM